MTILVLANVIAVSVALWALWELRLTSFGSRYDSPKSLTLILFALGALLDSPSREAARMSYSVLGRDYFLTVAGHICYLCAAAVGVKYIYLRLLPEPQITRFVKRRTVPAVAIAAAVMVVCFTASPRIRTMTDDHFYLVHPDGWLALYWTAFYSTLAGLLLVAMYGVYQLRADPRSVKLNLLMTSLGLGLLSVAGSAWGLISGRNEEVRLYAWPLTYGAIAIGALAVVLSWRRRVAELLDRES